MTQKLMSKKKPFFPINDRLNEYLSEYNRNLKIVLNNIKVRIIY